MKFHAMIQSVLLALLLAVAGTTGAMATTAFTPADDQGRYVFLIEFAEPGLLELHRQQRTSPAERFDFHSSAIETARDQLQATQARHLSNISSVTRRLVEPSHTYLVSRSGVAVRLTIDEARAVRALDGVVSVQREQLFEIETYRGPELMGAHTIWNGSATPTGVAMRGEGMVAAVLDTGILTGAHGSFDNDPACGHGSGSVPDKLLSALDCSSTNASGMCAGASPQDTHSHGSHVAGTVAGNTIDASASPSPDLPAPFTEMSGVAPCAHIRSYKVCPSGCPAADIQAGMDSALIHGDVDVLNFSISGGASPWIDNDRRKLDLVDEGIFVAASAGNNSVADPTVIGRVNHRGPWVMSVAASTKDGVGANEVSLAGGPTSVAGLQGTGPAITSEYAGVLRWSGDVDAANLEGCAAFPAGSFSDEAALIPRGTCAFADKINNAVNAGANFVVVYNNQPGAPIVMGGAEGTTVSSVMVDNNVGADMIDALDGGTAELTVGNVLMTFVDPAYGDVLASFSYRGPTPAPLQHLQKPDITGPGVNIYAPGTGASGFTFMGGTSMSSPHIAGAALLIAQANPDWTPSEIKSAMQMTASQSGTKDDGSGPWDWDDVGSGRADLTGAALSGLVMDETFANYLAANPGSGGDVRTLNIAAVRDVDCSPSCTWTRTVRNTLSTPSNWNVDSTIISGNFNISVSPSSFSFGGGLGETQELVITASPVGTQPLVFGTIDLTESGNLSPDLHMTVAIAGESSDGAEIAVDTSSIDLIVNPGVSNETLTISNTGNEPLDWFIDDAGPESGGFMRSGHNPDLDEVFSLTDFILPGSGTHAVTATGGVATSGDVIGFTFAGSVTGITGTGTWASDMGMEITAPDSQSYQVGGFGGDNPWDFDGSGSTNDGTYTSTHMDAFNEASDDGTWNIDFTHTWNDAMNWTNVSITLHKSGVSGPCAAPTDIAWLSVSPDSGTTAVEGSTEVDVVIDTTGMADGTYEANLCLFSNAINQSLIVIPVSVTVADGTIEPPTIDAAPANFSFDLISGEADDDELVIGNLGDQPLNWTIDLAEEDCGAPAGVTWLSLSTSSGTTSGGNSSPVSVMADSTGLTSGLHEALLCVSSNDPSTPSVEIPVSLDVTGAAEIDVAPASIDMALDQNDSDSEVVTISNFGESTLHWEVYDSSTSSGGLRQPVGQVTIQSTLGGQIADGLAYSLDIAGYQAPSAFMPTGGDGTTITHSDSLNVASATSVACSPDGGATTSSNSFLRTFTLGDFGITDTFNVSEVSFGIENLSSQQPITVNLYTLDGTFTFANLTGIGTATETLAAQQLTLVTVPIDATVPAGSTLVVEISPPDLSDAGAFFPGSNSAGQTAPSYIASSSCGIDEPDTYAAIGFPQVHLVMSVTGTVDACEIPDWISLSATGGTVAANDSQDLTVTLDATGLSVGDYEANICIASNDPINPLVMVPVALEVLQGTGAVIEGTVQSLGYCSDNPFAAEGALIEVVGNTDTYSTTADASGFYQLVLDAGEGPVTITASAPDHIDGVEGGVTLVAQDTSVVDFSLVLEAACATVTPETIEDTVEEGASANFMMTIGNIDGEAALNWDIEFDAAPTGDRDGSNAGADPSGVVQPPLCSDPSGVVWLSVGISGGTTAAGDTTDVSLDVDGSQLAPGLNEAIVCVTTDDAEAPQFVIPVSIYNLIDALFHDRFE